MGRKKDRKEEELIAIPPGETIKENLEYLGMTQAEFAQRMGLSEKTVSEIINGIAPITYETALKLENVIGASAEFWMNLEANYQLAKARIAEKQKLKDEEKILNQIPYNEMSKYKWVPQTKNKEEKIKNLRNFFGVSSLNFIPQTLEVCFRKANNEKTSCYALAAWIRKAEIEAHKIETKPFNKEKIYQIIPVIRELTKHSWDEIYPKLINLCSECGIALVTLPHLKGTYVNGATKWLKKDKVLLALSYRYKFADVYWFSFFHELGHILKHGRKEVFIEGDDGISKCELEEEADNFAANILIPYKDYKKFITENKSFTKDKIISFANSLNIHPCIVVGRLMHDKKINHWDFTELRPKVTWQK
ncbi:addiction module antidote protein, HigA family [Caldicellulosiruptor changbaiensis]|uniref:Addiction module antidote protein, HigA family n=1 Tax=Caldicellulosiruptor changbaiensis TaxID=1222016 RepID=A0A3T0D510_9FIRM|nr:HigA family addiction module antitoxin [Caldicellulosiruptor changbaiensis]AZT90161.1 addiction module antidote protein, HigA family [Caldicellulosiruptor changbaiensis]